MQKEQFEKYGFSAEEVPRSIADLIVYPEEPGLNLEKKLQSAELTRQDVVRLKKCGEPPDEMYREHLKTVGLGLNGTLLWENGWYSAGLHATASNLNHSSPTYGTTGKELPGMEQKERVDIYAFQKENLPWVFAWKEI